MDVAMLDGRLPRIFSSKTILCGLESVATRQDGSHVLEVKKVTTLA